MADRILKPDSGNDLVLQNDDASAKIEINEAGTIVHTGTSSIDVSGGTFTTSSAQKEAIVQAGPGSGTFDVSSGTFTTSSAQKQAIVQAGPGSGTLDVSSGTFTTSSAQKQAIVQAGPGSGTFDVSSGTLTTSSAQKQAIIDGASANQSGVKTALNASGSASIFACRAWVNFDGFGTFSPNPSTSVIRGSGNVSSITQNTAGQFTITFTNAMPDGNYCAVATVNGDGLNRNRAICVAGNQSGSSTLSASSVDVASYTPSTQGLVGRGLTMVSIFR